MSELTSLTIAQARKKLKEKEITSLELTDAYLNAIEASNGTLNAFVCVTDEKARQMARDADEKLAKGEGGPLEGVPIGVKDLFAVRDIHTQACSHILDGFRPPYESTVTQNLWDAGAIMIGKLNMDEFAMGSSNETSYYGPAVNPWRAKGSSRPMVPGGSSGGSAAAVAAHLCAGATGTDTGGSIRQPASFTGTVGLKPTYGRCSRWGMIAFASSLDQAGPIAQDVYDAAIMLQTMASVDDRDSTSVDVPVGDYERVIGQSVRGMKVGVPKECFIEGIPEEIERLWQQGMDWYRDAGAEIVEVSLPHARYALPVYCIVAPAEASSNLARYDGVRYGLRVEGNDIFDMYGKTRAEGFGEEVIRRILIGTYVLSSGYHDAYYLRAQKIRTLIRQDFEAVFKDGVDLILTPTTPSAAFALGGKKMTEDPVEMCLNDIFTVTANMAGLPAISVPAGLNDCAMPLGLQLIGKPFGEEALFQAANVIEQSAGRFEPVRWW